MARALALAERGRDTARPNPMVGCVVTVGDEIVGEGWHQRPGEAHAEVVALRAAGERARGATAYVTLEPCSHTGRTGPCTTALIEAGVERVVYSLADPNPLAGGGAAVLGEAGIRVEGGLLTEWASTQNEVFLHVHETGRPHVTLKLAQTLDGQLTNPMGNRWITGEMARTTVHRRRALNDVVLVGSQTVIDDDPQLDVRLAEVRGQQPRPVVLDGRGRIPLDAQVVRPGCLVFTHDGPAEWRRGLADAGVEVVDVPRVGDRLDLRTVMAELLARDLQAVFIEGGGHVAHSFVRERMVDRLVLHIALTVIGPRGLPRVSPAVDVSPDGDWHWRTQRVGYIGRDLEVVAVPSDEPEDTPFVTPEEPR